jgi:hypothetical protein
MLITVTEPHEKTEGRSQGSSLSVEGKIRCGKKTTRDKGGPMKTQRKIQILILAFGLMTFTSALADEARMKNGDRITGKIVRMEKEKLVLKTDYAG